MEETKTTTDILVDNIGNLGRMISGSKSGYRMSNPDGEPIFNGNIIVNGEGKVWYGDLDVKKEADKLQNAANKLGKPIYILREHDARFENEGLSFREHKKRAVKCFKPE